MGAHEVPVESLLAHAAFLRRLAGSLVVDPGTADDLVQETWLAAVRHPPEGDRPVGGWLSTVLRNVGRKLGRSGGRRDRRERASARREAVPSAEEQAARGEVVREVVDAVFRLDAPQRAVVLMRFYEDLPPREIARRLDVPGNTVKSRLRLALAHLRKDLDARSPSLRGDWRAALAPAVGLGSAAAGGAGGAVAAAATGGVVMGTKTTVAACVALVAALGTVAYVGLAGEPSERAGAAPSPKEVADLSAEGSVAPPTLAGADAPPVAAPPPVPPAPPPAAAGSLPDAKDAAARPPVTRALLARLGFTGKTPSDTLEVVVLDGTTPVEAGTGMLWKFDGDTGPDGIPAGRDPTDTRALSRDGVFRFTALENAAWYLGVELHDRVRRLLFIAPVTGKEENERVLLVLGTATVLGTVLDEAGRPAGGMRVRVGVQAVGDFPGTVAETRTASDGTYRIDRLPTGNAWVSVAFGERFDDAKRTRQQAVSLLPGSTATVDFGSRLGTPRLTGTLRFVDGRVVPGERQIVLASQSSSEYVVVRVAADGTYDQRVATGTYRVNVWTSTAWLYEHSPSVSVAEPLIVGTDDLSRDLVLPGARIVGDVRGPAPAPSSWVVLRLVDGTKQPTASAYVGPDAAYVWVALRPGTYELTVAVGPEVAPKTSAPVRVVVNEGDVEIRRDLTLPE